MSTRRAIVLLAVALGGCTTSTPRLPDWVPDVFKPTSVVVPTPGAESTALPVPAPPEVVQILKLVGSGARGQVTLTKTMSYVRDETAEPSKSRNLVTRFGAVTTYTASGGTSVADELGVWTFTYVPIALNDPALKRPNHQSLGIRFQSRLPDALGIDWDRSGLIDPAGQGRRIVHRTDAARDDAAGVGPRGMLDDWVLPAEDIALAQETSADLVRAFFETLTPGAQFSLVLTLRRGGERIIKRFVFEARPLQVEAPRPRPVTKWVGETFVALPRPPSRKDDAYEALRVKNGSARPLTQEDLAGAMLKVTAVTYDRLEPVVTLARDNPREEYTARPVAGSIEGLAPVADIASAWSLWVGKTLWLAEPDLVTPGVGTADTGVLKVKRFTPVQVVEIKLGWSSAAPYRFVLKAPGGRVGFRDVHTTGTNVPEDLRSRNAFAQAFFTEDPRNELDWPADVWTKIEDGRVVVGMTAAQARLSWGLPRSVERAVSGTALEERWTYPGRPTLVVVDGVVARVVY